MKNRGRIMKDWPEHIFRAYDIRGRYPEELDDDFAFEIGKAFGTFISGKVIVGMDVRLSSPSLKRRLVEGLVDAGCEVTDIGIVTTPMTLFATWFYNNDGGVMVTASHNPKEFNGFLFNKRGGIPISTSSGLIKIEEIFRSKKYSEWRGKSVEKNITEDYFNHVLGKVSLERKKSRGLKVVIDAGNAVTGGIYPQAFRKIGIDAVELFCEPDGNFPNRDSDPSVHHNLHHLQNKVLETGADFGFAYDCDGDRMAVVDETGKIAHVGTIFSIFIRNLLSRNPNSKIVYTFLDSNAIVDVIKMSGGIPVVSKVGHTFVTEKMLETGAILAGELSGHYFFKDMNYADDSLFASMKLIEFLMQSSKKISDYEKELPKYYAEISEKMRFPVKESEKFRFIDTLKSEFVASGHKVDTLEGVKVLFDDGWIVFRPSNTEAKIMISYESETEEGFRRLKAISDQIIKRIPH